VAFSVDHSNDVTRTMTKYLRDVPGLILREVSPVM
jgi:hypothetical protein